MKELVSPDVEAYAEAHSMPESDVCRRLREETYRSAAFPQMVVGPLEGAFLKMVVTLVQAKRVLEIGTFTGYSALCFAEALPEEGTVLTCDIDAETTELAKRYWAQSLAGRKIEARLGPALETMQGLEGEFDLIFIDADKTNYMHYYQRGLELLSTNGVMLIDNVLWGGEVLKHPAPDGTTAALQDLNRTVTADPRVTSVLVPIRDGVLVVRFSGNESRQ